MDPALLSQRPCLSVSPVLWDLRHSSVVDCRITESAPDATATWSRSSRRRYVSSRRPSCSTSSSLVTSPGRFEATEPTCVRSVHESYHNSCPIGITIRSTFYEFVFAYLYLSRRRRRRFSPDYTPCVRQVFSLRLRGFQQNDSVAITFFRSLRYVDKRLVSVGIVPVGVIGH